MKHENPSFANGMFKFNCPHCKGEIEIDGEQLSQVNTSFAGKYPCPLDGCGKEIEFPTAAEAEALQATASALAAPPVGGAAPAPAPPPQGNPAATPTAAPTGSAAAPPPQTTIAPQEIVMGFHGSNMASLEREAGSQERKPHMEWEYQKTTIERDADEGEHMNEHGADGWELVCVTFDESHVLHLPQENYYWKRHLEDEDV